MTRLAAVRAGAEVYDRLRAIDWSFRGVGTQGDTHAVHPYPAKFIPQIPRALIEALHPGDDSAVLDPFCGSGTTLVEAAKVGVPSIGIDLHPLACLISKVKVTRLPVTFAETAAGVAYEAIGYAGPIPQIPAIDHWFMPQVQAALAGLVRGIEAIADQDVKDALKVALSSIIVRVSNQESDTRYAAVPKDVTAEQVRKLFVNASVALGHALENTWGRAEEHPNAQVIHSDVLSVAPNDLRTRVSLVVTSPPYPNAYEYWLYHKYRMYWLGMDPIAVRNSEIGARPNYFKATPQTPADFERQMGAVFELLAGILTEQGHVCFQVGNSMIRGETIDNAALIRRAAMAHGFEVMIDLQREIPGNRKAFNLSHARIKIEDLIIMRLTK